MRITDLERTLVRSLPQMVIDESPGSGVALRLTTGSLDGMSAVCEIARNIAGHAMYSDYASPSDRETMTSWAEKWPALADSIEALNQVTLRTSHLLWLAARYQRRFAQGD